ncbi:MAG TPA: ArsA family ATPase [Pyrinomonadaceae bacterium]|nr:ArsA family ATPase [Pyrinomonadaceae bacterium]
MTAPRRTSTRSRVRTDLATSRESPNNISNSRYLLFGGKGGVGKTTAAAATAFHLLATATPDQSILLFSTDPAHSLADSLEIAVGNKLTEVARKNGARIVAFEMDAGLALENFRNQHGPVLAEIAERGTFLDESDISELLNLSLPGLDEVMALFELSELDRSGGFEHVIVDTAPTGHTVRLMQLPEIFDRMVNALDRMSDKHRYIVAQFARRRTLNDPVDLFLADLKERIERVRLLLHDHESTRFALVSIPEALSVFEAQRYYRELQLLGVNITDLIVNRVELPHENCRFCLARARNQKPWLAELEKSFSSLNSHLVPLQKQDVRGAEDLIRIGDLIWKSNPKLVPLPGRTPGRTPSHKADSIVVEEGVGFSLNPRKVVIFGGKGGVGKTTSAAAFALALAKSDKSKKILIFSTDPAHSLSDSFAGKVGPLKKRIAGFGNLSGMEIDPSKWLDDLKERYQSWIDNLFSSLSTNSGLEIQFDREAMRELVQLTPPGIDEIAALGSISDLIDEGVYDTIVIDSAPSGHLIRFLELPQVTLSWVRTFIKLLLKYQQIVRGTQIAEELVSLSRSIKAIQALMTSADQCEFIAVAIPELMSLEETIDLTKSLRKLNIPMTRLLVNNLVPETAAHDCSFCRSRLELQNSVVQQFVKHFGEETSIFLAPQQPNEVRGLESLLKHFQSWSRFESNKRSAKKIKRGLKRKQ